MDEHKATASRERMFHLFYYSSNFEEKCWIGRTTDLEEKTHRDKQAFKKYKSNESGWKPWFQLVQHVDVQAQILETRSGSWSDTRSMLDAMKDSRDHAIQAFADAIVDSQSGRLLTSMAVSHAVTPNALQNAAGQKCCCEHCGKVMTQKSLKRHQNSNAKCLAVQGKPSPFIGKRGYCSTCGRRATYALQGHNAIHCKAHAQDGEANVYAQHCEHSGCKIQPSYGVPGERAKHCKDHAASGEENVTARRCQHPGCKTQPHYGPPGEQPRHCNTHAQDGEEAIFGRRCKHIGCEIRASFGLYGEQPTHCKKHAKDGEENVVAKRCEHLGCQTQPRFGVPGERPKHCRKHADKGEEDVISKRCEHPGCKTHAKFGLPGEPPKHCKDHAESREENVVSKHCEHPECKIRAIYGLPGNSPKHCKEHAEDGEENVTVKRCTYPGCRTQSSFGLPGHGPKHCCEHAEDGEENVVSKRCDYPGCKTQPTYGPPGEQPKHCSDHADDGEEDVTRKCCANPGCKIRATFGMSGKPPTHCSKHAKDGEENVKTKRCSQSDCKTFAVADGFCTVHHPDFMASIGSVSKIGCEFIDCLSTELRLTKVRHRHYDKISKAVVGSEFTVPTTRYHVDGFFKPTDTKKPLPFVASDKGVVLEFHGHLRHGFPEGEKADEYNYNGARFGDLYEKTIQRMADIKRLGYTVVYIWENDFNKWKKQRAGQSLFKFCHVF